jgi:small neutral amino acid transporter SnatA (MarC family)
MTDFTSSILLLLLLLNPFFVILYLVDVLQKQDKKQFGKVLLTAGSISCVVFSLFAVLGDTIFKNIIQAELT